ncbi:MAG: hypothetical protein JJE40_06830 [Vicinamibacteria bacterium]|nr:hypothetical protein [Vicinamibacteria bacterium]
MRLEIEVWLKGNDFAITDVVEAPLGPPRGWTDDEVRVLLKELLRAVDRAKSPAADRNRAVALRGFNWIVSPFEGGGFTVAVEIQIGAAAAGPFDVDPVELEATITRVMAADRLPHRESPVVH